MITKISLSPFYRAKQTARERLAETYTIPIGPNAQMLYDVRDIPYKRIDASMKRRGHGLSFDEAFAGICYVLYATNAVFARFADEHDLLSCREDLNDLTAREFLHGLSVKEGHVGLSVEEITGIVSAASLDLIVRPKLRDELFEVCGMGGDRGFRWQGVRQKTINVSTLSSLVVAACGVRTMKHGSYSNTSAVGSTDSIEQLGIDTNLRDEQAISDHLRRASFVFTDAHLVKTIHDASHLPPKHETINHVIGPMTIPVSADTCVNKVMGVNEKVHPTTAAQAFARLSKIGTQNYGNVAVVAGLGKDTDPEAVINDSFCDAVLDELSPYGSIVAFVQNGEYAGTYALTPEDFGAQVSKSEILVPNDKEQIRVANKAALRGEHPALTKYLAMNAALCLYIARRARTDHDLSTNGPNRSMLQACFRECMDTIVSQRAYRLLDRYRNITNDRMCDSESSPVATAPSVR